MNGLVAKESAGDETAEVADEMAGWSAGWLLLRGWFSGMVTLVVVNGCSVYSSLTAIVFPGVVTNPFHCWGAIVVRVCPDISPLRAHAVSGVLPPHQVKPTPRQPCGQTPS